MTSLTASFTGNPLHLMARLGLGALNNEDRRTGAWILAGIAVAAIATAIWLFRRDSSSKPAGRLVGVGIAKLVTAVVLAVTTPSGGGPSARTMAAPDWDLEGHHANTAPQRRVTEPEAGAEDLSRVAGMAPTDARADGPLGDQGRAGGAVPDAPTDATAPLTPDEAADTTTLDELALPKEVKRVPAPLAKALAKLVRGGPGQAEVHFEAKHLGRLRPGDDEADLVTPTVEVTTQLPPSVALSQALYQRKLRPTLFAALRARTAALIRTAAAVLTRVGPHPEHGAWPVVGALDLRVDAGGRLVVAGFAKSYLAWVPASPEQAADDQRRCGALCRVEAPNARTVVHELGQLAYTLLVGRYPSDDPAPEVNGVPIFTEFHPLEGAPEQGGTLSPEVVAVLTRALAPEPGARYATPLALADALAKALGAQAAGPFDASEAAAWRAAFRGRLEP